jgi:biotin carboxyl carrier protein
MLNGVPFEAQTASNGDITTWLVRNESESTHGQARNLPNDRVDVWIACIPFATTVQMIASGYTATSEVRRHTSGGQVKALMPGRITSIFVKGGESVKTGAALLILEAMKMQNEITAPTNGKIKTIYVHEGDTVKKDSPLLSIE